MCSQLKGYIYSITNEINGKSYIGKTNDLVRRWKEHCYGQGGTTKLDRAFKKYGLDSFVFEIVAQVPFDTVEELNTVLNQLEMYYIALYDTFHNGYNATAGGEGTSYYHHTEETKRKISLSNRKYDGPRKIPYRELSDKEKQQRRAVQLRKISQSLSGRKRDHDMIMRGATKRRKPVLKYDLNGNFIQEYDGLVSVGEAYRINVGSCCKGKLQSAYGYVWRYKESEAFPLKIDVSGIRFHSVRPVLQYDSEGNFIREYSSLGEAATLLKISPSSISVCLSKEHKTAGSFYWRYKESSVFPLRISIQKPKDVREKVVLQFNREGMFIQRYDSVTKAANVLGINRSNISNCLNGRSNTAGGYIWKYEERKEVTYARAV